jgi:hypothetical protein
MSIAKNSCPYTFHKDGEKVGVCGAKPVGRTKLSDRQINLGVPADEYGYTGSDMYCKRHQIFEKYWPYCKVCHDKRVCCDAKGKTAGYCFECISNKTHEKQSLNIELSDQILIAPSRVKPVVVKTESPNGAWTSVVKKSEKKSTKEDFQELNSIKLQVLQSETVKEAMRQAEASRIAALAAEEAYKQIVAAEELRIANEISNKIKQEERENTESLAAEFAAGFNPQLTKELLAVIRKYRV